MDGSEVTGEGISLVITAIGTAIAAVMTAIYKGRQHDPARHAKSEEELKKRFTRLERAMRKGFRQLETQVDYLRDRVARLEGRTGTLPSVQGPWSPEDPFLNGENNGDDDGRG